MNIEELKQNILDCDKYLHSLVDSKIIYSGDYALFLNNIELEEEPKSIDVYLQDVSVKDRLTLKNNLNFRIPINLLPKYKLNLQYIEIDIENNKLLVYTPESITNIKQRRKNNSETIRPSETIFKKPEELEAELEKELEEELKNFTITTE